MHDIGVSIIWLSLQVTIVAVASAFLYLILRRRGPLLRSLVISSSMLMTLLLALLAFSPWPKWSIERAQQSTIVEPQVNPMVIAKENTVPADSSQQNMAPIKLESVWSSAWSGFVAGLEKKQSVENAEEPLSWPSIIGFLFLGGISLGLIRLCVGYILLKQELKHTIDLDGSAARERLDGLLMEHNYSSAIRLRETQRLATAAIVGWWRPVMLLPHAWRTWSTEQMTAVLTHELSHILQRDFLSNLCAEISRSIYFYHPLMHWLASRLRLEQELAADAEAARSTGGTDSYLVILAEMAMAQANRSVRGPARAFLPTQSTFLRRIDMLKDKTPFTGTVTRTTRVVAIASIMLIGMMAVGIRGDRVSIAQNTVSNVAAANKTKTGPKNIKLDFVPNAALAVIAMRPAQILSLDSMQPIQNLFVKDESEKSKDTEILGFRPSEIETGVFVFLPPDPQSISGQLINKVVVIQVNQVLDQKAVVKKFNGLKYTEDNYGGKKYYKVSGAMGAPSLFFLDDHTLVIADDMKGLWDIIDTIQSGKTFRWSKQWQAIEKDSVAAIVNVRQLREIVRGNGGRLGYANASIQGLISPIWENTDVLSLGMSINQNVSLKSTLYQAINGDKIKKTLEALLTLSDNMLEQMKQDSKNTDLQKQLPLRSLLNIGQQAVKSALVNQDGENVSMTASLHSGSVAQMVAVLVPAIMESRVAASRMQSMNNIKRLMLALHNYHDIHKHFPPAVVLGPDGKTPHSWRVAILPYLEQKDLYDEYNRGEPWDSEHNLKVLAKMPAVFRNPNDMHTSNNAAYFGVVGKNTFMGKRSEHVGGDAIGGDGAAGVGSLFGGAGRDSHQRGVKNKSGLKIQEITDGTSNTIAIVEAKRDIPWTKPEDIKFDGKKIPKFGGFYQGGFNAGFCDGSVRFLPENLDQKTLKNLLTINDGNPVKIP